MPTPDPITFTESAHVLYDVEQNAVLTTRWGNLAIFSTAAMAAEWQRTSRRNLKIVEVRITPVKEDWRG